MVYPFVTGAASGAIAALLVEKIKKNQVVVLQQSAEGLSIIPYKPISKMASSVTCTHDTDILANNLEPINKPCLFRIQLALSGASIFKAVIKQGLNESVYSFNSGVALIANSLYIFDLLVHEGDEINFQTSADVMAYLRIQEIALGTE
jgi:hypothetical protein